MESKGISAATVSSADGKKISVSVSAELDAAKISVADSDGNNLQVKGISGKIISLESGDVKKIPYAVTYSGTTIFATLDPSLIDEVFGVKNIDVSNLGLTVSGTSAAFKTFAPLATQVNLLLFSDSRAENLLATESMTKNDDGTFSYSGEISGANYYQYEIKNAGQTNRVADIFHTVASADSVASQIISIDDEKCMPSDWENSYTNPAKISSYADAVIYEMHIRDWSRAVNSSSTGKFTEVASEKITAHLKDLGVTHVQILPMFDYAQKNSDGRYNWGYNPYHYNVPEGRYVSDGYGDGSDAVKEMRQMIKSFHDAGIAVIMDVVYNHTDGTGNDSLYDMTVPKYFYRLNSSGAYSDGSGCGNEIATNHALVKNYVIESLKHWMNDYHINGFRFDLMGVAEKSTMQEIFAELKKIDSKVMVYGEPWTGGISAVTDGCTGALSSGVGAFDDDFRDAIKGAEFGGFKKGHVQGTFNDDGIIAGLTGNSGSNSRGISGRPELSVHYAECHDNFTLFDKLAISSLNRTNYSGDLFSRCAENLDEIKKQDELAAAYIFLSQGTPFINGGQEFLRTKNGDENSYKSADKINQIDLTMKEKFSDVYNFYKGLIALRKANSAAFGKNTSAAAKKISGGITEYRTGDFLIYFNATDEPFTFSADSAYTKSVDVSSGAIVESTTLPEKVGAKSFVILKK